MSIRVINLSQDSGLDFFKALNGADFLADWLQPFVLMLSFLSIYPVWPLPISSWANVMTGRGEVLSAADKGKEKGSAFPLQHHLIGDEIHAEVSSDSGAR